MAAKHFIVLALGLLVASISAAPRALRSSEDDVSGTTSVSMATEAVAPDTTVAETTMVPDSDPSGAPLPETTEGNSEEGTDAPAQETTEAPAPAPETTEAPAPAPETTEAPAPAPETTEAPAAGTTEAPAPDTTQAPAQETTETPAPETTEAPAAGTTEAPAPDTTQAPAQETTETPAPETTEAPAAETTEAPVPTASEMVPDDAETTPAAPAETTTARRNVVPRSCADLPNGGEDIIIPNPESCNKFIICFDYRQFYMNCPANLYFNYELQVCDWPQNVDCVESTVETRA